MKLRAKVTFMGIMCAAVAILMNLIISLPRAQVLITDSVSNNMLNLAKAYGKMVEIRIQQNGNSMILQEELQELFQGVKVDGVDSCYPYFVSSSNKVLYHPDESMIGTDNTNETAVQIVNEVNSGLNPDIEPKVVEYSDKGKEMIMGYYVLDSIGSIVMIIAEKQDAASMASALVKTNIAAALIAIVVALVVSLVFAGLISKPLKRVNKVIGQCASLDFTSQNELKKSMKQKDEIGDMSLSAQAKVLRVLQENKLSRVGSDKDINVKVRVVAATNKNLLEEIAKGNFREDLYHRLSVIVIHVPSLAERKEDIPLLVNHFIGQICSETGMANRAIADDAVAELQKHAWTGNIRELRNVTERLLILGNQTITKEDVQMYASPLFR